LEVRFFFVNGSAQVVQKRGVVITSHIFFLKIYVYIFWGKEGEGAVGKINVL